MNIRSESFTSALHSYDTLKLLCDIDSSFTNVKKRFNGSFNVDRNATNIFINKLAQLSSAAPEYAEVDGMKGLPGVLPNAASIRDQFYKNLFCLKRQHC